MKTENISETVEETITSTNKLFSESFSSMLEVYRKQMEFSYDMFNNFLNPLKSEKNNPGINTDMFTSGTELLKKNIENMTELSRKMMLPFMNLYSGKRSGREDGEDITGSVLNAYKLQMKQIADINQKFFKTFNETFKTTKVDSDHLYNSFRESTERNMRIAEDEIKRAMNTFIAVSDQSSKDFQKMIETSNKQIEMLTKNNMNLWSDLLKKTEKESKKAKKKNKEK